MLSVLRPRFPSLLTLCLGAAVAVAACGDVQDPITPNASGTDLVRSESDAAARSASDHFHARLSGDQEVPAVDTDARGVAQFWLSDDGMELSYRLIVANIENVLMSHIHLAPAGSNGGVVVWLYPDGPPPQLIAGRFSGVLATGTITAADLTGSLAGASLADLVQAMASGGAYVNVHTPANPPGEIRGQIRQ